MSDGWTKTPNRILDAMPFMNELELKLTAVLLRQTFGWKRNEVRLTWDDIQEATSIKGRASVGKAIEMVEKRGFFVHGRKSLWAINSSPNELSEVDYSSPNELKSTANSSRNELNNSSPNELNPTPNSSRNEPPSIIEKKEEEKKENKERIEVEQPELPPSYLRLIPIEMATPEFIAAVGEWLAYQYELTGRELPTRTLKNQLLTLRNYPVQTAIAMINQSINQGWKGLFDLRQSGGNGKSSSNGHYPKPTPEPLPEEDWSTAPPSPTW